MNFQKKTFCSILLLLSLLVLASCQPQVEQIFAPTVNPSESTLKAIPTESTPTQFVLTMTATPEVQLPEPKPEIIVSSSLKGLRITLVHPWVNEKGDAFEAIVAEFNETNELGIEVICRRVAGFEALNEALIDGTVRDHMVITRGFDLAGVDDGTTWINLSDAPGIEGLTQAGEPCSNCAEYLDQVHQERYITLLYQPALLYYNQTWARELGFEEAPRTPQALQAQMQAAAAALLLDADYDNNGAGGLWLSMTPQSTLAWYRAFEGVFNSDNVLPLFEREPIERAFGYLKDLRGTNGSWRAQNPTAYQYFGKRNTLAYEGTLDDLLPQEVAFEMAQSTDEWITLPYPTADGSGSVSMETIGISIKPTFDKVEAGAAYFVRWLQRPEQMKKLVEVTGLWPVGGNPSQIAPDYAGQHPAWASALSPTVRLMVAPEAKNWGLSRLILQDAGMRVYALDAQFIPTILDMLDATLVEAGGAE